MFPMYSDMSPHPYQGNQMPYPRFFNPTLEAFPPQMKEDQPNTPQMHQHWPHNYAYSAPTPCQNCCSHGQHPSYHYFRPPYPQYPSPPPFGHYCGGGYPYPAAFPQPYPYVPPPYYPMEMPTYEYDKGLSKGFHCCECPNHPSHVKSMNNVKIEEHDPDEENKKAESSVPATVGGVSESPYPILWIPPGNMSNKERPMRMVGSDTDEQQVAPFVGKSQAHPNQGIKPVEQQGIKPIEHEANGKYQWFPLDIDNIKRLMEGGEVMKPRDQEKKDGDEKKVLDLEKNGQKKQFPCPIIWMPYDGRLGERSRGNAAVDEKEDETKAKRLTEKHPCAVDVAKQPVKEQVVERAPVGGHADAKGAENRGSCKSSNVRIIPVKQLDDHAPEPSKKEQANEKNGGENGNCESAKNGTDVKPSSATKKSKLPPICLRVDPPRKKNGKGNSRSPSPPGKKTVQESGDSNEERTDKASQCGKEEVQIKKEKVSCTSEHQFELEGKTMQDGDSGKLDGTKSGDDGKDAAESLEMKNSKHKEDSAQVKKFLSEVEAAVIVQSAYRGYAVRRWEPLKKLRQIAGVSEEASKIKKQIEKLESCGTLDNKEKVAIGENIMNLLLKLDTIQGLHSSVRDVRKSVAKELVTLQEKLDSIESHQKSIPTDSDISPAEVVQEHPSASSSEIDSTGSSVFTEDTPEVSEQGEAPEADKIEKAQNEGEKACQDAIEEVSEVNDELSQNKGEGAHQDAIKEVSEVSDEPVREPQNEESGQPVETPDCEAFAPCLEVEETEVDKCTISSEETELLDHVSGPKHFEDTPERLDTGSCSRDEEEKILPKSPQGAVEERVEDDICRMDWECDLGAAKTVLVIDQETEAPQLIEEEVVNTSAPTVKCAVEIENVDEEHAQPESHGEAFEQKESKIYEVESSEICNNVLVEEQLDNKPVVQSVVIEHENNTSIVTGNEENSSEQKSEIGMDISISRGRESEKGLDIPTLEHKPTAEDNIDICNLNTEEIEMGMDIPVLEHVPTAKEMPSVIPDTEAEEVSGQENSGADRTLMTSFDGDHVSDEQAKEITDGLLSNPQTVSGDRAAAELPEVGEEEGGDSVQMERRIIEENEKLRDMVEKLLASGKQQQDVITGLTAKVKNLEKKLPKRHKLRILKRPGVGASRGKALTAR